MPEPYKTYHTYPGDAAIIDGLFRFGDTPLDLVEWWTEQELRAFLRVARATGTEFRKEV